MELQKPSLHGEILRWKNLTVVGLRAATGREVNYVLASKSFERGKLRIHETSVVSSVEFRSSSGRYTLVPEGERLIGGKQDRVVNCSVLIPPYATVQVAVSCVEKNRWRARANVDPTQFSIAAELAAPHQRAALKSSVGRGYNADQQSVWQSVGESVSSLRAGDLDGSLSQAYEQVQDSQDEVLSQLSFIEGANGVLIAVGRKVRTVEVFNNPRKLEQSWKRIILSHLLESRVVDPEERIEQAGIETAINALDTIRWQPVADPSSSSAPEQSASTTQRSSAAQGASTTQSESRANFDNGNASSIGIEDSLLHASVVFTR